jgi:hypothetical protein
MATKRLAAGGELVPGRSVPAVADTPELREWAVQLVARARGERRS